MGFQFTCFQFPWKQESTPSIVNLTLIWIGQVYETFKNRLLPTFITIASPFLIT